MFCVSKISSGWNLDLKILANSPDDFGPKIYAFSSPQFNSIKILFYDYVETNVFVA